MIHSFSSFGIRDAIDVALVSALLYLAILWVRRVRAKRLTLGIAAVSAVYLLSKELDMKLTESIFQGIFAFFLIVLVVIFQPELRRLFERVAAWSLAREDEGHPAEGPVQILVDACSKLAARKWGALVVIPGRDPATLHFQGGLPLDGKLSVPLLMSLFEKHSEGHDGAVVLNGDRVARFSVHLPLSTDFDQLGSHGTRHAAALGLTERSDALCIVVSEERGRVSVARDAKLRELQDIDELRGVLERFLASMAPATPAPGGRVAMIRRNWMEKLLAVALALVAWYVFVSGPPAMERGFAVPVTVADLPEGYVVEGVSPETVDVILDGQQEDFDLLDERRLKVQIDGSSLRLGRQQLAVSEQNVEHPAGLTVVGIVPRQVEVVVRGSDGGPDEPVGSSSPSSDGP